MQDSSSTYSKKIALFWKNAFRIANCRRFHPKECKLPLARIKRLMKVEEDVKMIAAEVPVLFSAVTEVFVQELTARAWMCTEDGKRKILQSGDISFAVKTSSMYDFLTFIISTNSFSSSKENIMTEGYLEKYPFKDGLFLDNLKNDQPNGNETSDSINNDITNNQHNKF